MSEPLIEVVPARRDAWLTRSAGRVTVRLLEEYLAHHHSPYTKKAYAYELGNFFRTVGKVDLTLVTRRDLLAYKEHISSRYKPSTVTWKLTAVGGFLRYAHK